MSLRDDLKAVLDLLGQREDTNSSWRARLRTALSGRRPPGRATGSTTSHHRPTTSLALKPRVTQRLTATCTGRASPDRLARNATTSLP